LPSEAVTRAYVGLGANLGDAAGQVEAALVALAAEPGCRLAARSALYRSAPVDAAGPDFINAVAALDTTLDPHPLLARLQAIEQRFGRERPYPNAPRTLDLDLLLHGQEQLASPTLTLPHPRLHQRAFVLMPLAELVPDLHIPGLGTVRSLLAGVAGQAIEPWSAPS
jgi:2-amino-4-hydroxy-6-hydroxymethyldihydropteridine diphosphokinase